MKNKLPFVNVDHRPIKFIIIRKDVNGSWLIFVMDTPLDNIIDMVQCSTFTEAIHLSDLIQRRYALADLFVQEAWKGVNFS